MWTEASLRDVLHSFLEHVDGVVQNLKAGQGAGAGNGVGASVVPGRSQAKLAAGVHELADDVIKGFCQLEVHNGRLDSPCFRMGSAELRLHRFCGKNRGDLKPAIRAMKRGKHIVSYATCCNGALSRGCIVCDRLPRHVPTSYAHIGDKAHRDEDKEVYFINELERSPIRLESTDDLMKMLCLAWVGRKLYKTYLDAKGYTEPRNGHGESGAACNHADVPNHATLTQLFNGILADKPIWQDAQQALEDMQSSFDALKNRIMDINQARTVLEGLEADLREDATRLITSHDAMRVIDDSVHRDNDSTLVMTYEAHRGNAALDMPSTGKDGITRCALGEGLRKKRLSNLEDMIELTTLRKRKRDTLVAECGKAYDDDDNVRLYKMNIVAGYKSICEILEMETMFKRLRVCCGDGDGGGGAERRPALLVLSYDWQ